LTIKKSILLITIITLFIAGCLTTAPTQAQLDGHTYLPLITKNWPHIPIFGVAMHDFVRVPQAETAGVHWIRHNALLWSEVQPNHNNEWYWNTNLDTGLAAASQAGMEVILITRRTPAWAQRFTDLPCGPIKQENFIDFANFMAAAVSRYSAPPYNVTYYEIWNEPDGPYAFGYPHNPWGCWGDPNDPYYGGGYFAEMLKVVYPAIKAANPAAKVVMGGLIVDCDPSHPGTPGYCATAEKARAPMFLEGVLRNGGGPYFDFLNLHAYNYYSASQSVIMMERLNPNWSASGGAVEGKLAYIRGLLSTYGVSKPIMFTETGLLFDEPATADFEQKKAQYVVWLFTRNLSEGIIATTWYTLDGPGWRNSGLLDADQNPLPAYYAFQTMTQMLGEAVFVRDVTGLPAGVIGFEFNDGQDIWVLFSEDGSQKSLPLPAGFDSAYDLYGNLVDTSGGQILFSQPVYVTFVN
jgi:hypothetical protein